MKVAQLTAALIATAVIVPAFANGTAAATPESTASMLLNPATMAEPAKEPRAAVNTIIMLMDPATLAAMMTQGMNPATYTRMGQAMMDPRTMQNYMQFMDPAVAMKWMGASMDPNFYMGMASPFINPNTYMKWGMAPMDPRMMGAGMQMMNPGLYANWMTAPMNPANTQMMMAPMNPALYSNWANTAVNPQTYGTWGGFMNPGTYTNATQGMNPFSVMTPMMPAPAGAPAAPMFGMVPGYGQPGAAPAVHAEDRDADRSHPITYVKDSIITTKIKAKLAADHPGSMKHISVDTDMDGVVWLSGTANTQEEINAAIDTARNTEGVKSVKSDINITNDR
ncbi:MAG: BON domain-containing protein [Thiobacillaceae bacterium]